MNNFLAVAFSNTGATKLPEFLYSSEDMPEKYEYVIENFDKLLESHGAKRENIIYR